MREGAAEGLEFWRADDRLPKRGCFYPPTLVTGVEPASILAREEIFGPVLVATTFRTPDEAVALANNTRYGLAASVWTRERQPRARSRGPHQGGRRLDQFDQPVRRRLGLRRLSRERFRPRGRPRGLVRVPNRRGGRRASRSRPRPRTLTALPGIASSARASRRPRPHRQALCRRQAGAARFRLQLRRPRPQGPRGRPGRPRQSQGHPQRGRGRGQGVILGRGDRAQPGAGALLRRRESERARRRVRQAPARDDRRLRARGRGRGRGFDPPRLLLCGLRRQVRRRGPCDALALRHAGDERALGRDGDRLPGRSAAARLCLARHAGDRDGQLRRRRSLGLPSLERDRFLFGPRHVGCSCRRRQYRDGRSKRARRRRSPSTTASTRSGTSATPAGATKVEALSAGNLKATWVAASARSTGRARKAASSCAARSRSRTSGRPTASELTIPLHRIAQRAERSMRPSLPGRCSAPTAMKAPPLQERAARSAIVALRSSAAADEFVLRRRSSLMSPICRRWQDLRRAAFAVEPQHGGVDVVVMSGSRPTESSDAISGASRKHSICSSAVSSPRL